MRNSIFHFFISVFFYGSFVHSVPDRESFAHVDRPIEGVPVDAFQLLDDNLTIELWARSPMIYSPVSMDFDAAGRLWLTEGIDYQRGRRVEEGLSLIHISEPTRR